MTASLEDVAHVGDGGVEVDAVEREPLGRVRSGHPTQSPPLEPVARSAGDLLEPHDVARPRPVDPPGTAARASRSSRLPIADDSRSDSASISCPVTRVRALPKDPSAMSVSILESQPRRPRRSRRRRIDHHAGRAGSRSRTSRSFRSSRATAPAPTSGAASQRVFDGAVRSCLRRHAAHRLARGLRRREGEEPARQLAPRRHPRGDRPHLVAIKGPLTTPVGGGFRSLNVALRQKLDLYACVRPVRWFEGVPSPVKAPQDVNMVIFRENTEDIYAGIEYKAGTDEARRVIDFLQQQMGAQTIRFPDDQRHRHQAGLRGGLQAADPRRHRLRRRPKVAKRDAGAQGQHHEVHRGRLPRLGLPARPRGVRRHARSTAGPGAGCPAGW